MKTLNVVLSLLVTVLLLTGCGVIHLGTNIQTVNPSNTVITEERNVSGFTGIDFSGFGNVMITQGDNESLTIKGSDNVVPLVETSVANGVLTIKMKENVNVLGTNPNNVLTFNINVKNLTQLTNSGLVAITMDALNTNSLNLTTSGAGQFTLGKLTCDSLQINMSGLGGIEIAGETNTAKIDISGAGSVKAPDLKIKTVDVTLSGLGGAELWVTDQLTGDISGAGNISYYGNPQVNKEISGLGKFESKGNK